MHQNLPQTSATLSAVERITGLDVTRGFAVMGILAMNIIAFAMPEAAYVTPRAWGGDTGVDLWAWAISFVLVDSKMRGLFSIMFGASTLLVLERAAAAGASPAGTHYRRMLVLALFGLAHFFFLWFGDILFIYAVMGMVAYAFRDLSVRALTAWGIGLIVLNTLVMAIIPLSLGMGAHPGAPAELASAYQDFIGKFAAGAPETLAQLDLYRGGFATILGHKLTEDWATPAIMVLQFGAETLGLMLLGMALFKSGLLRGGWSADRLHQWAIRGIAVGLLGNLALLWWQLRGGLNSLDLFAATFVYSVPFDVPMSVGYAALAMWLAQRYGGSDVIARIAATGQTAFTNYLGTSLVMTFIFYGWGLGMFGSVNRAACYLFVIGAWAAMLMWSRPWLSRHRFGPLEWLWRSISRGRLEPLRR